jgi:hypothetical protein
VDAVRTTPDVRTPPDADGRNRQKEGTTTNPLV